MPHTIFLKRTLKGEGVLYLPGDWSGGTFIPRGSLFESVWYVGIWGVADIIGPLSKNNFNNNLTLFKLTRIWERAPKLMHTGHYSHAHRLLYQWLSFCSSISFRELYCMCHQTFTTLELHNHLFTFTWDKVFTTDLVKWMEVSFA